MDYKKITSKAEEILALKRETFRQLHHFKGNVKQATWTGTINSATYQMAQSLLQDLGYSNVLLSRKPSSDEFAAIVEFLVDLLQSAQWILETEEVRNNTEEVRNNTKSVDKFNKQSTFLAWTMIGVGIVNIVIMLFTS